MSQVCPCVHEKKKKKGITGYLIEQINLMSQPSQDIQTAGARKKLKKTSFC